VWIVHVVNVKPKAFMPLNPRRDVQANKGLKPAKGTVFSSFLFCLRRKFRDDFAQSRRREAMNTAREEKKKQTATLGCAFLVGAVVPELGLAAGASLATGGKGGSATSASVKGASGA